VHVYAGSRAGSVNIRPAGPGRAEYCLGAARGGHGAQWTAAAATQRAVEDRYSPVSARVVRRGQPSSLALPRLCRLVGSVPAADAVPHAPRAFDAPERLRHASSVHLAPAGRRRVRAACRAAAGWAGDGGGAGHELGVAGQRRERHQLWRGVCPHARAMHRTPPRVGCLHTQRMSRARRPRASQIAPLPPQSAAQPSPRPHAPQLPGRRAAASTPYTRGHVRPGPTHTR
jgi:hypothetical protein